MKIEGYISRRKMEKIKVLIADDHPAFREGLRRLLEEAPDLEVVAVTEDGKEAVDSAKKLQPDVGILDVAMPYLDGIEAAKLIGEVSPATKILMLSAAKFAAQVKAALQAGAAGFLLKNAPVEEIIRAIRMVQAGKGVYDLKAAGQFLRQLATRNAFIDGEDNGISPREIQVLKLVARGASNRAIARQLDISGRTTQTHLNNIFSKLKVNSRSEAVFTALKEGWISLDDLASKDKTNRFN
jgi:DNA-binding NarL/FixJ family response regulator